MFNNLKIQWILLFKIFFIFCCMNVERRLVNWRLRKILRQFVFGIYLINFFPISLVTNLSSTRIFDNLTFKSISCFLNYSKILITYDFYIDTIGGFQMCLSKQHTISIDIFFFLMQWAKLCLIVKKTNILYEKHQEKKQNCK
jgi:hypothetical protein